MNKNYILTLLMSLCLTVASFGQELMLNGGLEEWSPVIESATGLAIGPNLIPTGWSVNVNLSFTQESIAIHGGTYSAKQTKDDTSGYHNLVQIIPNIQAGESYTISFWYKIAAGTDFRMASNFRDSSKVNLLAVGDATASGNLPANVNIWTKYETIVTAPAGSVDFRFDVRLYKNTTVYFDDFSFFDNATASLKNNAIVGFATYPNPVSKGTLTISSASNSLKNITIFNLLGKQVLSSSFSGVQSNVDVSSISAGIYILKVTEAGKTTTKKVVIR